MSQSKLHSQASILKKEEQNTTAFWEVGVGGESIYQGVGGIPGGILQTLFSYEMELEYGLWPHCGSWSVPSPWSAGSQNTEIERMWDRGIQGGFWLLSWRMGWFFSQTAMGFSRHWPLWDDLYPVERHFKEDTNIVSGSYEGKANVTAEHC